MTSPPPESILVVRLGAMGDVIHTLSAVTALRTAFPEVRIGWAIEERWCGLLCASATDLCGPRTPARPIVDCVHLLDTKAWRKSAYSTVTWRSIGASFGEIRRKHYATAIDFQGAIKSALITRFSGARATAGFASPREGPARFFYQQRCAANGAHVVEHYHALAEQVVGQQLPTVHPEFPRDGEGEARIARAVGASSNLVILNPGAGWGAKQWPAQRYGEVAKALAQDGLRPLINFSPNERDLASSVEAASGGAAVAMACTIGELIALMRRAKLFIGGDTGPLHLAAACNVSAVAIFGPTDPSRNGPFGTRSVVLRHPSSRTSLSHTSVPDPGLLQISVEEVVRAARQLLEAADG